MRFKLVRDPLRLERAKWNDDVSVGAPYHQLLASGRPALPPNAIGTQPEDERLFGDHLLDERPVRLVVSHQGPPVAMVDRVSPPLSVFEGRHPGACSCNISNCGRAVATRRRLRLGDVATGPTLAAAPKAGHSGKSQSRGQGRAALVSREDGASLGSRWGVGSPRGSRRLPSSGIVFAGARQRVGRVSALIAEPPRRGTTSFHHLP